MLSFWKYVETKFSEFSSNDKVCNIESVKYFESHGLILQK